MPDQVRHLRLGESYRFARADYPNFRDESIANSPNWFYMTDNGDRTDADLRPQAGIWNPKRVSRGNRSQLPIIICTSSPHKGGTFEVPWSDIIRPDDGYAIYYGDNRNPSETDASSVRGNRSMLEAMRLQHSSLLEDRLLAPPILIVTTHGETGQGNGFRRIEGLGVIKHAELILQRHPDQTSAFQNLRFEIAVLDLKDNSEKIPSRWINARRRGIENIGFEIEDAPVAWQKFVQGGFGVIESLRRNVMRSAILDKASQVPREGSHLEEILIATIAYFDRKQHQFESVAARIVERIFSDQGLEYRTGWLTPRSGDGGYDFVGRINFDPAGEFPSSRQIILGQAKCERGGTSGKDLARLAARLRRGWYGAYVTTSHFSPSVQNEVHSDQYPMLMIPGLRVASIIKDELDQGQKTLVDYLAGIDNLYPSRGIGLADVDQLLLT